jgi:hypothetical protein
VGAGFDGGAITSDAIALLLGQTDRAIRLTERFGACFSDTRAAELVEYQVEALVMQLIVGIVLGYEDLNDHDELGRDPVLAVMAAKLEAQRSEFDGGRQFTFPLKTARIAGATASVTRNMGGENEEAPRPSKPIFCYAEDLPPRFDSRQTCRSYQHAQIAVAPCYQGGSGTTSFSAIGRNEC